jgi:hypothetical protein
MEMIETQLLFDKNINYMMIKFPGMLKTFGIVKILLNLTRKFQMINNYCWKITLY